MFTSVLRYPINRYMFTVVNNERKLLPVPLKTWKRVRALKITTQNNNKAVIQWKTQTA